MPRLVPLASTGTALAFLAVVALSAACAAAERPAAPPDAAEIGRMVRLPGGTFRAGALTGPRNDQVNYHPVRAFLLDVTEVTVAEYGACVKAGRCKPAAATVEWDGIRRKERAEWAAHCNGERADRGDHPVNCVDWNQARTYCAWAGKRLPSEEEWEWAARNGKKGTAYPWGDEAPGERACWKGADGGAGSGGVAGTCPAGSRPAGDSAAGVKDLAGNVWEWTSSRDVVGWDSRGRGGTPVKVARGGSWTDADPRRVSAWNRLLDLPTRRSPDLGFRCARSS